MNDIVKLSDVATVVAGVSPAGSSFNDAGEGLPFFQGAKEFGFLYPSAVRFTTEPKKVADSGDILLSVRAPVGRVNFATERCAIGRGVMAIQPNDPLDRDYLFYMLSAMGDKWEAHATDGTMFANLSKTGLETLPVNWLSRRRETAEVLSAIDDRLVACKQLMTSVDELLHARWEVLFGERQDGTTATLRGFCDTQYGMTASGNLEPVGPRLLRVTDINKQNWVDWSKVPYCEVSSDAELEKYQLHHKDLVVARMADPGKSAIIDSPTSAVFASYLIRVKPLIPNAQYFTFGYLKSRYFTDYSQGASSGSVQANMNAQTILDAPCELPSNKELKEFEEWSDRLRSTLVQMLSEQDALRNMRSFLLPRLVSGELRVEEAEELVEDVAS